MPKPGLKPAALRLCAPAWALSLLLGAACGEGALVETGAGVGATATGAGVGATATGAGVGATATGAGVGSSSQGVSPATGLLAQGSGPPISCQQEGEGPFILPLGSHAVVGEPVRFLVVSEGPLGGASLEDDSGQELRPTEVIASGPPAARLFEGKAPLRPGVARYRLGRAAGPGGPRPAARAACVEVKVSVRQERDSRLAPPSGIWDIHEDWHEGWERAFSAWVAWLFRDIPGQPQAWRPLQRLLWNPERNLLYDSLGLGEDSGRPGQGMPDGSRAAVRVIAWADCGDAPYQLRAYFAWKHGLPFRYRRCDRGSGLRGPRCPLERDNRYQAFDQVRDPVARFNAFLREGLAWQVHSGTTRTLPEDEASDFFPIRLSRETIRPGTIFVDVGGHVLIVTQWDAEGLFAVDGHPDFSVTRRRYSEGHFRYFRGTRTGGFKAFRPLRLFGGALVPLPNKAVSPSYSVEQYRFSSGKDFQEAMARMLAMHRPG